MHQSVLGACRDFPEMVAGEGRLTTRKMREIPGLFLKEGAEGVQIASLPDGRALGVKVDANIWRRKDCRFHSRKFLAWIDFSDEPTHRHFDGALIPTRSGGHW